ncbi:MAG: STAS domain-containing protein [Bacteroidaceae bacterium]|nr:STAS domain-containing protein [Bacteroidaceae bacterium]
MNTEVYRLGEELDSFNYQQVQEGILAILEKGCSVVLDMTNCKYISSTGLRVLLYSKKVAASKGLKLYLVGLNDEVKDIMDVTGFNSFFDFYSTMEECQKAIDN